jgi:hypothetical protein
MNKNPTPEQMKKLWDECAAWVEKTKPYSAESIYQSDSVQEGMYDLTEIVCENVGYAEVAEDDADV